MRRERVPGTVRSVADFDGLSPREREANRAAFRALELMRSKGYSRAAAARKAGIRPETVQRYVGPALERRGRSWVARPADRLLRLMEVLGEGGVEHEVPIRGSRVAALVGAHWSAIGHYLESGDASRLMKLQGKRVAGRVLETDPDAIDAWERRGELQIEEIYSLLS